MREPVLMIGAAGHARAVLEAIRAEGRWSVIGLIDSFQPPGTPAHGLTILGGERDVPRLLHAHAIHHVVVAIGDNFQRAAMWARLQRATPGVQLTGAIHPATVIAPDVTIGLGTVILPGTVVVSGARIGQGCILNTACTFDHEGEMADWSSLGPGAIVGGRVRIGLRTAVALGARVIHRRTLGADSLIGAGSLVLHDVPDAVLVHGAPARIIRTRRPDEPYL